MKKQETCSKHTEYHKRTDNSQCIQLDIEIYYPGSSQTGVTSNNAHTDSTNSDTFVNDTCQLKGEKNDRPDNIDNNYVNNNETIDVSSDGNIRILNLNVCGLKGKLCIPEFMSICMM